MNDQRIMELRTMDYHEYLKTPEWAEKRELALERDGYRCRVCNTRENPQVHHRTYARRGNEDLNDLTTLCKEHHEMFHERMHQVDMMAQTYIAPHEVRSPEERMKNDRRQWEDYLNGLLVLHPGLCLHVCGIVSENDFSDESTRSLYNWLYSVHQRDMSIEGPISDQLIPDELQEIANRARMRADSKTPKDGATLVNEAIQVSTRIKRMALIQRSTEMKYQIQAAFEAGDHQLRSQLRQELLSLNQQRRVLDAATRLQG